MINVFICDDHELIRNGIKSTLKGRKDIKVVGEAGNGEQTMLLIADLEVDILLLDISMPVMNGIELIEHLVKEGSETKVLFLTMYDNYEYINKCLEAGAAGYLVKSDAGEELVNAITTITSGSTYYSNTVHKAVMDNYTTSVSKKRSGAIITDVGLTKREKEIVKLIARGMTSIQIAEKLFVSPRTVDTHRANLMKKLEVKNSPELVYRIRELNLFEA